MKKDMLFESPLFKKGEFMFNQKVVDVFDDMIDRSVPFYRYLMSAIVVTLNHLYCKSQKITVTDLGCSTGALLRTLFEHNLDFSFRYVGVDNSDGMLANVKQFAKTINFDAIYLLNHNLNKSIKLDNTDVVVLNLILQFLDIDSRQQLLKDSYRALKPGGVCFFIEKCVQENKNKQNMFVSNYHYYKKLQGYSDVEIANKDNALKGVLKGVSLNKNIQLLKSAGFNSITPFYQWFNFIGLMAFKDNV